MSLATIRVELTQFGLDPSQAEEIQAEAEEVVSWRYPDGDPWKPEWLHVRDCAKLIVHYRALCADRRRYLRIVEEQRRARFG